MCSVTWLGSFFLHSITYSLVIFSLNLGGKLLDAIQKCKKRNRRMAPPVCMAHTQIDDGFSTFFPLFVFGCTLGLDLLLSLVRRPSIFIHYRYENENTMSASRWKWSRTQKRINIVLRRINSYLTAINNREVFANTKKKKKLSRNDRQKEMYYSDGLWMDFCFHSVSWFLFGFCGFGIMIKWMHILYVLG